MHARHSNSKPIAQYKMPSKSWKSAAMSVVYAPFTKASKPSIDTATDSDTQLIACFFEGDTPVPFSHDSHVIY